MAIVDFKVILGEFLGLADLPRAKGLSIHELPEVVIVNKDEDFIFASLQVMTSSLKRFNNSQELLIVSFVSRFGKNHLP